MAISRDYTARPHSQQQFAQPKRRTYLHQNAKNQQFCDSGPAFDALQKRFHVFVHVRLSHFHREAPIYGRAERELVDHADINAGD